MSSMSMTSKHVLVIGGPDDLALDAIEALGLRYSMVQRSEERRVGKECW